MRTTRPRENAPAAERTTTPSNGLSLPAVSPHPINQDQAPIQRMPDDALDEEDSDGMEEVVAYLRGVLNNARMIANTFPNVTAKTETFRSAKALLYDAIGQFLEYLEPKNKDLFIEQWNEDLTTGSIEYYAPKGKAADYVHKPSSEGFPKETSVDQHLNEWYGKKRLVNKSMVPDKKMAAMVPLLMQEHNIPEDILIALKLFFGHTANFVPQDKQGRDFSSKKHGQYYRSSLDPIRAGNAGLLQEDAMAYYEEEDEEPPQGEKSPTYQVINKALKEAIELTGKVDSNVSEMNFFGRDEDPSIRYAEYMSSGGMHTGALGLIQNVYRTIRVGTRLQTPPSTGKSTLPTKKEDPLHPALGLDPIVDEDLLAPGSELNYHDLLLQDRATLIQEVSAALELAYEDSFQNAVKVIPIQSGQHASLILDLQYPKDYPLKPLEEKAWRETFIAAFNRQAQAIGKNTRVTHRGSFGFLYPTASSVGGPVRIWPGLIPPDIFKQIIFATLRDPELIKAFGSFKPQTKKHKRLKKKKEEPKTEPWYEAPEILDTTPSIGKGPILHLEALKSAVRYAQDTMANIAVVKGPKSLFEWIKIRLVKNLTKAKFLLQLDRSRGGVTPSIEEQENDYLKSTLVIENLMEYSYLLEALNVPSVERQEDDPYPEYLRSKLLKPTPTSKPVRHTHTFYLDSGMQSIVTAHLLARRWIAIKRGLGDKDILETIDLYSYFEYAMVDRKNLFLNPLNRKDRKKLGPSYQGVEGLDEIMQDEFEEIPPAIIAADLNPVFTKSGVKEDQASYQDVFKEFAGNGKDKGVNKNTVPIVDVTNASLDRVADLNLPEGYENFIVLESLSKHQQLGADKFTMGRLSAIGTDEFVAFAMKLIQPIEDEAKDRLTHAYRLRMDQVYYGNTPGRQAAYQEQFFKTAPLYNEFMQIMGKAEDWIKLLSLTQTKEELEPAQKTEVFRNAQKLLKATFQLYVLNVTGQSDNGLKLDKAFQSLPLSDQQILLHQAQAQLVEEEIPILLSTFTLTHTSSTGITNIGNTCYLASTLNLLAFSPHRQLFTARDPDPHADLRGRIRNILTSISSGAAVGGDIVADLLLRLNGAGFLEGHNAFAQGHGLYAQRDPAEVLEFLLDFFGTGQGGNFKLEQSYTTKMDMRNPVHVYGGDTAAYSRVDDQGNFAVQNRSEWLLALPITGASNLQAALLRYIQPELLTGVRAVHQGLFGDRVISGEATRQIGFTQTQQPLVVTIHLKRWVLHNRQIIKDNRPVNMPELFQLNNNVYQLNTVLYHQGGGAGRGHYTTSTLSDQGWQFRDDRQVSQDQNFVGRKDYGYIFNYTRIRVAGPGDNSLMNIGRPHLVNLPLALPQPQQRGALNPMALVMDNPIIQANPTITIQQGFTVLQMPLQALIRLMPSGLNPFDLDQVYRVLDDLLKGPPLKKSGTVFPTVPIFGSSKSSVVSKKRGREKSSDTEGEQRREQAAIRINIRFNGQQQLPPQQQMLPPPQNQGGVLAPFQFPQQPFNFPQQQFNFFLGPPDTYKW